MAFIKECRYDKNDNIRKAQKHTEEMFQKYGSNIESSLAGTKIYSGTFVKTQERPLCNMMSITIEDMNTVQAACCYKNSSNMALLNFASYKNPGGMFLNGSMAQEECLCHASFLYNVLAQLDSSYYCWNRTNRNRALYKNRGLFTPGVIFENGKDVFSCSVITCAAPNKSAAQKYCKVTDAENSKVLESRIKFVLDIALSAGVDTLILGAFGCGVFGQDAYEVAEIFKKFLESKDYQKFYKVIFAIPKGKDGNLEKFRTVFKVDTESCI